MKIKYLFFREQKNTFFGVGDKTYFSLGIFMDPAQCLPLYRYTEDQSQNIQY